MREPSYHPAHAYLEAGPARPGRVRRQTAGRMASMRARLAAEGRPDAAALDRAIVDALREAIARTVKDGATQGGVYPEEIVVGVAKQLHARSKRAKKAGRTPIVYRAEAVADAIHQRILAPKPAPAKP
ncbi:hypothetical protein [Methylorubrum sp. DB1722]|uniref:hypothetical protein n=1 Tax=Methylorubrum sp. DB1722 TaxID=2478916 RepID=UPI0018E33076|nr:hypothetical protein [Methylorubrum sp. DB1722]MBI1689542.1 hypothetical protein [Methylorubrum sp. DB1722]